MILSGAMLFEWLGGRHGDAALTATAAAIQQAVAGTIAAGVSTRDLGGTASTSEFTTAVIKAVHDDAGRS